jgi:uncharacterized protein
VTRALGLLLVVVAAATGCGSGSGATDERGATTDALGLMHREELAPGEGMVFLFDEDETSGFWMKNTLIPLSIAFYDANGVIVRILDMEPCTEEPCPVYEPGAPYRGALEVNRGAFRRLGVEAGDRVTLVRPS